MISALRSFGRRFTRRRVPASVALALSGGAVLGAAHIGVLKALEERQVTVSRLAGTSIGAFVAALYAFGKTPDQIADIVMDLDWLDIGSFTLSRFGLLSNSEMGKHITDVLGEVSIEESPIPLSMIATDLSNGEKVVLEQGDVATAVMASACIPGVFIPVEIDDRLLCDGGLVENLPVSPLEKSDAGFIIGVDLNAHRRYQRPNDIVDLMVNVVDISIDHASRIQAEKVDLLITPELGAFSRTDTSRMAELIEQGYKAMAKALDEAGRKRG